MDSEKYLTSRGWEKGARYWRHPELLEFGWLDEDDALRYQWRVDAEQLDVVMAAIQPFILNVNKGGQWDSVARGYPSDMREHRKRLIAALKGGE